MQIRLFVAHLFVPCFAVMLLDFDHHATTPLDPRVLEAMLPYLTDQYGNPSSISHRRGLAAAAVELASREQVAGLLGVKANEVIWTSGAITRRGMDLAIR